MKILIVVLLLVVLPSCGHLNGYRRTYSFHVMDESGRKAGVGVTFEPVRSGK